MRNFVILFVCLNAMFSFGQCNGSLELCAKKYDEVAYLTTHNAFNATDQGFSFPNQNIGITAQLNMGVRGLMLDVYYLNGVPTVYHGFSFLGNVPLVSNLEEIRLFLEGNPTEIVSIIFECYVDADAIEGAMNSAGLASYLYAKPVGQDWDSLGDMIANNKRLVVFTDVDDWGVGQEWYHYAWDYAVETHFTVNSSAAFTNDFNRGAPTNDLFIFNHFVTSAALGTGVLYEAQVVNQYSFLMNRIQGHFNEYAKFPNFITLDFVDEGNGMQVVDSLNASGFILSTEKLVNSTLRVSPNPSGEYLNVWGLDPSAAYTYELIDARGKLTMLESSFGVKEHVLEVVGLHKCSYILRITANGQVHYNHTILLH